MGNRQISALRFLAAFSTLLAAAQPAFCVKPPTEAELLKKAMPLIIEDIDLGYLTRLSADGKATAVETEGSKPAPGKPGTWKLEKGRLIVKRSFDGKRIDKSDYPIAIFGGEISIDGDSGRGPSAFDSKAKLRTFTVNSPD